MPIANVFASRAALAAVADPAMLVTDWSRNAGIPDAHMTLNLVAVAAQSGARFDVMAFLYLPTLWPDPQVEALQLGLADAIATGFDTRADRVQVVTTMVQPGHTVVGGKVETW